MGEFSIKHPEASHPDGLVHAQAERRPRRDAGTREQARLTLRNIISIFESVCGGFEGREADKSDHLAKLCEVIYGILDVPRP